MGRLLTDQEILVLSVSVMLLKKGVWNYYINASSWLSSTSAFVNAEL